MRQLRATMNEQSFGLTAPHSFRLLVEGVHSLYGNIIYEIKSTYFIYDCDLN